MIWNQYYAVLASKEVKKNHLYGVTRFGEKLVFYRTPEGKVACLNDRCCHRGASLCTGKLHNGHPQCPFHGFEYDSDGKVCFIPANGKSTPVPANFKVNSYVCKEKGGFILKCTPNSGPNQKAGYFSYEVHIRAEAEVGERLHVRGMGAHPRRMPEFNR